MIKTIEAIYENGVLKPITPISLPEHKKITLTIEGYPGTTADILSLASTVYSGLSKADIDSIELVALDRNHFSRD